MKCLAITGAALALSLVMGGAAKAQSACDTYRVKRGDTLREISQATLGTDDFRRIWRLNRTRIGRNPDLIREGMVLAVPCRDGQSPEVEPAQTAASGSRAELSLVTASGYLPYSDEGAAGGGLVSRLVETALMRASPDNKIEIAFVNDWSAHLDYLLPRGAFDGSFPWVQPDCSDDRVGKACDGLVWSEPVYEIVEGYFSRRGDGYDAQLDASGLSEARICRPDGYPVWHMIEAGVIADTEALVRPQSARDCFDALLGGQVDLVAIETRTGDMILADMGAAGEIVANPHLVSIEALRVALPETGQHTEILKTALNDGISTMLESGEWDAIVSDALGAGAGLTR